MVDGWLATPKTSVNVCWVGGIFELTFDDTSMSPTKAWSDIWHHNGGWTLKNSNTGWIFDGVNFVVSDRSRRPQMAFVAFVRELSAEEAEAEAEADPPPTAAES